MITNHNFQRTFELAAQGLANLGKKDSQLTTASFGALQLRDREGNIISTLDYSTTLNRAWNQAHQALSEQGIDITPDWAQKPFLAQLKTSSDDTQNLGIYITPEKLVVKAWMVDLSKLTSIDSVPAQQGFVCSLADNGIKGSSKVICLKYPFSKYLWTTDKTLGTTSTQLWIKDSECTSVADFKAKNAGIGALVELATPIEIPFDSPLNFDFPRVNDTDILSVLDIDGEEMFRIESGHVDEAYCTKYNLSSDLINKNAIWTDLYPNPEWIKAHNTLPGLLILDNLRGIGRRFDVKYLLSLEQRLQALEDKLKDNNNYGTDLERNQ